MEAAPGSRRKRKEEGKRLKRQRIQESGGVRPRKHDEHPNENNEDAVVANETKKDIAANNAQSKRSMNAQGAGGGAGSKNAISSRFSHSTRQQQQQHRFGRVMEKVPCRGQPRVATVSMAIPGSIVANCQTRELKTQITGQIARAATIYHVDEIVVFDDKLSNNRKGGGGGGGGGARNNNFYQNRNHRDDRRRSTESAKDTEHTNNEKGDDNNNNNNNPVEAPRRSPPSDPHAFMARILQYAECPQYLRRHFFPMHPDLQFAGLLPPVDAPHHVRAEDRFPFREGVVLDKTPHAPGGSLVNCGIRGRPVHIEQKLQPGIRCTVQLDPAAYGKPGQLHGKVVSPSTATRTDGTYWGYVVRIANSIKAVFDECPYPEGKYDLTIGTSERGNESVDDDSFTLLQKVNGRDGEVRPYQHALIVFGGVAGIEECVDADESMKLSGSDSHELFDKWINVCPYQGSRTIRSEEAVLITLAKMSPFLAKAAIPASANNTTGKKKVEKPKEDVPVTVKYSDDSLSEESSSDDDGDKDEVDDNSEKS